ncbi:MAG: tetratricopeptide repeat protein [Myxococcota bacterium]|nr:tetratricopeptide repeat protein [Myxococcota bacterium]
MDHRSYTVGSLVVVIVLGAGAPLGTGCTPSGRLEHPIEKTQQGASVSEKAPSAPQLRTLPHSSTRETKPTAPSIPSTKPAAPPIPHIKSATQLATTQGEDEPLDADACADCHYEIVEGFSKTGMGRSLYRPGEQPIIEDFSNATVIHPIDKVQYRAYVDAEGRWWQEESLPGSDYIKRVEVTHIIGSGNHTRSYLGEVEGNLVQMPLTWYSGKGIWDMSPGYQRKNHFRFDRPVRAICLFCHNDLTVAKRGTASAYAEPLANGMSCSRCHGDGRAHVQSRMAGKAPNPGQADPTIFNPGRHSNERQLQVCQQCHLAGESRVLLEGQRWDAYDPSKPLGDYMAIYTYVHNDGADFGIASHGSRLAQSACFKKSDGKLACTQCHNPHKRDVQLGQRTACLTCHTVDDCDDRHGRSATGGSCAKCHMHRGDTSDIPHVTFTDHFIRRKPSEDQNRTRKPTLDMVDALRGARTNHDAGDELVRDGIAHARRWRLDGQEKHRPVALKILPKALKARPNHATGWNELAMIYKALGQLRQAESAFSAAVKADPENPDFWLEMAEVYEHTGQFEPAEKWLRRLIKKQPDHRPAWGNLANLLFRQNKVDEAEKAYIQAEKLGPTQGITASNRGYLELKRGRYDAAEKWFREALKRDGLNAMMHANLGTLAIARKQINDARQHFETALKRNPNFVVAHWMIGRIDVSAGRLDDAKARFRKMIDSAPRDPRGYMELAGLHVVQKNLPRALMILRRAQEVMPEHPQINQMIMHIAQQAASQGPSLGRPR